MKEHILVLRNVKPDMTSHNGFKYPKRGWIEAPDWEDTYKCGHGLHGLPWGCGETSYLYDDPNANWLVLKVNPADGYRAGRDELTQKCKFRRGYVVYCGTREGAVDYLLTHGAADKPVVYAEKTDYTKGSIVVVGDRGTAIAGNRGTAIAGNYGTATTGDYGTATAGYRGTATAGYRGTATAGYRGTATAGNWGTATAGYGGTAIAGYEGTAIAGYEGTATTGENGTATTGENGTATTGENGTATAGDRGTATAGYRGTATAGYRGIIQITYWDNDADRRRIKTEKQVISGKMV